MACAEPTDRSSTGHASRRAACTDPGLCSGLEVYGRAEGPSQHSAILNLIIHFPKQHLLERIYTMSFEDHSIIKYFVYFC